MKNFNGLDLFVLKSVNYPLLITMLLPLIEIRERGNCLDEFQQKCLHNGYVGLTK